MPESVAEKILESLGKMMDSQGTDSFFWNGNQAHKTIAKHTDKLEGDLAKATNDIAEHDERLKWLDDQLAESSQELVKQEARIAELEKDHDEYVDFASKNLFEAQEKIATLREAIKIMLDFENLQSYRRRTGEEALRATKEDSNA